MTKLRASELYLLPQRPVKTTLATVHKLKIACAIAFLLWMGLTTALGQTRTFTSLLSFDGSDGSFPQMSLVQGTDGNFYGTTPYGGAFARDLGCGTVFKISATGNLTTLYSFDCTDGASPYPGLIRARNGKFYGVTSMRGANGDGGTVFEITPDGKLTTLYNFCSKPNCRDGSTSYGVLVQATNGNFYGTTSAGGAHGKGTVFEITPQGKLTTLYSFCSKRNCADGAGPFAGLVQAVNGNLYGTTSASGVNGEGGTIFEITPKGELTTLYSFCAKTNCNDGATPYAELVQAGYGRLYGTTYSGGEHNFGTIFEITLAGKLTILHSFDGADGSTPYTAALIRGSNGDFYGTTFGGGVGGSNGDGGTVFKINQRGKVTTLYSFCIQTGCVDGRGPVGGLMQATNGNFYGTTIYGRINGTSECGSYGTWGCGTLFALDIGLRPFVKTIPASGKIGARVIVLGNDLTEASSVTFNGTEATFKVLSDSVLTAIVPAGATTGEVEVTLPNGILKSNSVFQVATK
jgi:uncharacterized repeat protein (TIGR03803 family)